MEKIRIDILPNLYLNEDGTFNTKEVLNLSGKIAGVCYDNLKKRLIEEFL